MAQTAPLPATWHYTLIEGSQLTDDCPICDRIPIVVPMRGSFEMRLLEEGPLFTSYAIEDISFHAGNSYGFSYKVTGQGVFEIGGEVALVQKLYLDLKIDNGATNDPCYFQEPTNRVPARWPMLREGVDQTNGTMVQQYHLEIAAAPFREIWFSTASNFTAGIWNPPTNPVSGGDLLSTTGRRVKSNSELARQLGPMPPVPDLGLKGLDILPGGEIAFSIEDYIFSETLGPLYPGDLLSNQGRVLHRNQDLVAAFEPESAPADVGLSAVQVFDNGETWFSVQTGFYSKALARTVTPSDLISDRGVVIKSGDQLLAPFGPAPGTDPGLKSVYVWPSGEIWFSTAKGFPGADSHFYGPGDLLSDQGYLVYTNAELLLNFQPPAASDGFGLDGLFVITDVTPPAPAPLLLAPELINTPPSLVLRWSVKGRVFQLEKATTVSGPFLPVSPIISDTIFVDPADNFPGSQVFYRLRQW